MIKHKISTLTFAFFSIVKLCAEINLYEELSIVTSVTFFILIFDPGRNFNLNIKCMSLTTIPFLHKLL